MAADRVGGEMAGPGIRYHHFARELARSHEVTLVVPNDPSEVDLDIRVIPSTGLSRGQLVELCRDADAVVGQPLEIPLMAALARAGVRTVYDLYVPAVSEHLAFHAGQGDRGAARRLSYRAETQKQLAALAFGTAFICASDRQRDLWLGMLAALGRLDPSAYEADATLRNLIEVVPFGLDPSEPAPSPPVLKGVVPGIGESDRVLLWGGGIWNWFDPLTVIRAVERSRGDVKVFFLGSGHPNPVVEPMAMAARARKLADSLGLTGTSVIFNDGWVPYEQRRAYFREADLGVSAHFDGIEARFAFRTRLLDHFAAGLPSVVTGGDVLGDLVGERGLGAAVPAEDVDAWVEAIGWLLSDSAAYETTARNSAELQAELAWPVVVGRLAGLLASPAAPMRIVGRTRLLAGYYSRAARWRAGARWRT